MHRHNQKVDTMITVPNLINFKRSEARVIVQQLGLSYSEELTGRAASEGAEYVFEQHPMAGTLVPPGSVINAKALGPMVF